LAVFVRKLPGARCGAGRAGAVRLIARGAQHLFPRHIGFRAAVLIDGVLQRAPIKGAPRSPG